jgi:hypothetical protein
MSPADRLARARRLRDNESAPRKALIFSLNRNPVMLEGIIRVIFVSS